MCIDGQEGEAASGHGGGLPGRALCAGSECRHAVAVEPTEDRQEEGRDDHADSGAHPGVTLAEAPRRPACGAAEAGAEPSMKHYIFQESRRDWKEVATPNRGALRGERASGATLSS